MKKFFSIVFAALLMTVGFTAHAQQTQASNQAQCTATKSVDLASARKVNMSNLAAVKVTDYAGTVHTCVWSNPNVFTFADAAKNYKLNVNNNDYVNLSQTTSVDCVGSQSVIAWHAGSESLPDSCSFSSAVYSASRR